MFPLIATAKKLSEKWVSCKVKIEGIPLAAKALPSPLLPTVLLAGINSVNNFFNSFFQTVGVGFYMSFLCALLTGSLCTLQGETEAGRSPNQSKKLDFGRRAELFLQQLDWTKAWVGVQGAHLLLGNAHAK